MALIVKVNKKNRKNKRSFLEKEEMASFILFFKGNVKLRIFL